MAPRFFWLSLFLAIVCIVMFAGAYYSLFERKHVHPGAGYGLFWLVGSPILVGVVATGVFCDFSPPQDRGARVRAIVGAIIVSGVYLYALMFVTLNTLGS